MATIYEEATRHTWLTTLQPGQSVLVSGRYDSVSRTVARVTATQVVLDNGTHYRKKDGQEVGRKTMRFTGGTWLREATPEALIALKHARLRMDLFHAVRGLSWERIRQMPEEEARHWWDALNDETIQRRLWHLLQRATLTSLEQLPIEACEALFTQLRTLAEPETQS